MRGLFLAPHNDDEVLFGTFTLLRHNPHVVICLRSARMADPSYPGGMVVSADTREAETAEAMNVLGLTESWRQWPILDTDPDPDTVEAFMWGLRDPSGQDDWDRVWAPAVAAKGQPDHNLIGQLASVVFSDVEITWYLTYTSEGKQSDGVEVPFEPDWVARKHAAMSCYSTQAAHPATRSHFLESIREYVL